MKKLFIALLMILALTAAAAAYTPGVYKAKATGNNPNVPI